MEEFAQLREELATYDALRDNIIKRSRDIIKFSKQAIYSLHRDDLRTAKDQLKHAEAVIKELRPDVSKHPALRPGSFSAGLEEYSEAKAFLHFLETGKLVTSKELGVETEEYLRGLCDFTGELVRYAVHRATQRNVEAAQKARDMVDAIFGQLIQFDFRNSDLRRKYDSVKYNLQKLESVLYDLALNVKD